MRKRAQLKQQIEYLRKHPTSECVEWPFACAPGDGYGRVWTGEKLVTAHRLAYELYNNTHAALYVLHTCDNPHCINPLHLYEGTPKQNQQDRRERGVSKFTIEKKLNKLLGVRKERPMREETRERIMLSVSKETKALLEQWARDEDRTVCGMLRRIIAQEAQRRQGGDCPLERKDGKR